MARTEITDLDELLLGPPKRVRLSGHVYTLPAQIPVPLYLLVRNRSRERVELLERGEDLDIDAVEEVHQQVLELFQVHQPDMDSVPCGIGQLFEIIPTIYPARAEGEDDGEDEEDGAPPTTPARRGSRSSTRSRSKATRPR